MSAVRPFSSWMSTASRNVEGNAAPGAPVLSLDPAGVRLEVVPIAAVRPHEIADPSREGNIERRLRDEGVLRDPLIVGSVPDVEGYVLLDGTNRRHALASIGLPYVLVQIVDYRDHHAIDLLTWCHLAEIPLEALIGDVRSIPGLEVSPIPPLGVSDALDRRDGLAVALDGHSQYALTRVPDAPSLVDQLRLLVER